MGTYLSVRGPGGTVNSKINSYASRSVLYLSSKPCSQSVQ